MKLCEPATGVIQQCDFPFICDRGGGNVNDNLLSLRYKSHSICKEKFGLRLRTKVLYSLGLPGKSSLRAEPQLASRDKHPCITSDLLVNRKSTSPIY